MKVIPTEEIEWETVVANARAGHVQRKYVREGEILPGVGYASDCYNYVGGDSVFTAPRHHHDFEQIRISMTGVQDFGLGQIEGGRRLLGSRGCFQFTGRRVEPGDRRRFERPGNGGVGFVP